MKKTLFLLPAIVFLIFYLCIAAWAGIGSIDWAQAIPFTIPLVVGGMLLCKNIFWGGLLGMLPAIYLMSFGKNTYTGLELPIGAIIFVYFAVCFLIVFKQRTARN